MPASQFLFWAVPVVALVSYCLLMLIFAIAQKDKLIKSFMFVLGALILWTASSLFMKMDLYPGVQFWNKMLVTGIIAVPYLLYIFVSIFTDSLNRITLTLWSILALGCITINALGLVIINPGITTTQVLTDAGAMYTHYEFYYDIGPGAYALYIIKFTLILAILDKARRYIKAGNSNYGQIGLISFGVLLLFLGALLNINTEIGKYPVDILFTLINSFLIVIAIYKYRMLELRFIVTKGLVYTGITVIITGAYVASVLYVQNTFHVLFGDGAIFYIVISALLVAILFQPVYKFAGVKIDKIFYKAQHYQRQVLKDFSVKISNNLNLTEISTQLIDTIQAAIESKDVILLLSDEGKGYFTYKTSSRIYKPDYFIADDNPLARWFNNKDNILMKSDLYSEPHFKSMWEKEKKSLRDLEFEIIVPIKCRNILVGMLILTKKKNSTAYTPDDLDLLTYLSASSAVAIDNARLFAKSQDEALRDGLTNLHNHRYFRKVLPEQVSKVGSSEISLLLLDLDMFKLFNDLYGHLEGDKALEVVASIMLRVVGDKGVVCRYGGEEFTTLLPYYDSNKTYDLAEKIRTEIQERFFSQTDTTQRFLTASIGICTYPHCACSADEMLKRADLAMYAAKKNGKNQTVIYTPNIDSKNLIGDSAPGKNKINTDNAATIYALTAAIDAKDHYTFGHSHRVAEYVCLLTKELGLDATHQEVIKEAALLHDIGKIGIPEAILNKSDKLDKEEIALVQKHVEMCITIIKHLSSQNHVIPTVIGHHERWDGLGYPRGLSGENIPLGARCLAVCDAFDAMTSNRSYRPALSIEKALQEVKNNIGVQFDPELSKLFIKLIREGVINPVSIKEKYPSAVQTDYFNKEA